MGLRLSPDKTLITHIDEGLVFLGWHIQRHRKRGTDRYYVYTSPSRKALKAVMAKVKALCRATGTHLPLDTLLLRLNPMLRGWCNFFRRGVSSATFQYLSSYVVEARHQMDTTQTPPDPMEGTATPLRRWSVVANEPGQATVRPGEGRHHALPIPGRGRHPKPLANHWLNTIMIANGKTGLAKRPVP
jgi:hypothetical protein